MVRVLLLSPSGAWTSAIRRAAWVLLLAIVLWLVQSAIWTAGIPIILRVFVCGLAVVAAFSPAGALLIVTGLAPFAGALVTLVWQAYAFQFGEALVLAFFAGYLWSERRRLTAPASGADGLALPSRLFTLVVLASCLVQILLLQAWHDYPLPYLESFVTFLRTQYSDDVHRSARVG